MALAVTACFRTRIDSALTQYQVIWKSRLESPTLTYHTAWQILRLVLIATNEFLYLN